MKIIIKISKIREEFIFQNSVLFSIKKKENYQVFKNRFGPTYRAKDASATFELQIHMSGGCNYVTC